jgi:tripartite-type tricarboxylate transporter receptor subunit TctC
MLEMIRDGFVRTVIVLAAASVFTGLIPLQVHSESTQWSPQKNVEFIVPSAAGSTMDQVRAGTIKAYAVTAKSRSAIAPEIPSVGEVGLP